MSKPFTWLLDFDGVINASKAGWSSAPFSGNAYYRGNFCRIRWAPQLIARIHKIHQSGLVDILWASSWCGHTEQLEMLTKLPALGSACSMRMDNTTKLTAALDVVDSGKRLIWTDDEAIPFAGKDFDILAGSLLIAPKANRGLRPEHLDKIDAFVLA